MPSKEMGYLLGIDFGTGGAKACLIDTQGEVRGFAFEEYLLIVSLSGDLQSLHLVPV